jgi:hypothetical protein
MTRVSLLIATLLVSACGWGGPPQPLFDLSGRVVDSEGNALPGAVVTDGEVSALTDESGRYSLSVFEKALAVTKPGYSTVRFTVERGDTPTTRLGARDFKPRIGLDARGASGGLTGLREALKGVVDYPGRGLADLDALVVVTPGSMSEGERGAMLRWVHAGGCLVLCGEWGGYPAQDIGTLNALAQPAGITFTGATVKLPASEEGGQEGWDSRSAIAPPSLASLVTAKDSAVYLFSTGALALAMPARAILQSDRRSYSVLAVNKPGAQVIAAVGAHGRGKVFAFADSSLWLDEDSSGSGRPNVSRGANAALASALLAW